jgi:hypothetical protein
MGWQSRAGPYLAGIISALPPVLAECYDRFEVS